MNQEPAPRLCLDFVNTEGEPRNEDPDRLLTLELFLPWAVENGLLDRSGARQLRVAAAGSPAAAERFLRGARALRQALLRVVDAARAGEAPEGGDLRIVNRELGPALAARQLTWDGSGYRWQTMERDAAFDRTLAPVVLSAAALLRSDLVDRVKECRSETCSALFIDRSRNHSRRWCDMAECGNRAKARRFYRRHAKGGGGAGRSD